MSDNSLTGRDWIRLFEKAADAIEASSGRLNELDGEIGDGDHGVTMSIGFRAVRQALDALPAGARVDEVFAAAGKSFLNAAGGAIGPIIGTMWTDAAKAFPAAASIGASEIPRLFQVMEQAVIRRGKASLGDKTLLDALHPAVEAVHNNGSAEIRLLLERAAEAALEGARGTASMLARMGRSSRLGERTLGHEDAGANSLAIVLKAMADAATNS